MHEYKNMKMFNFGQDKHNYTEFYHEPKTKPTEKQNTNFVFDRDIEKKKTLNLFFPLDAIRTGNIIKKICSVLMMDW